MSAVPVRVLPSRLRAASVPGLTDGISHGSSPELDNLSTRTVGFLIRFNSLATSRAIWQKDSSTIVRGLFTDSVSQDDLRVRQQQTGGATEYAWAVGLVTDRWYWIFEDYDDSRSPRHQLHMSFYGRRPTLRSPGLSDDSSGTSDQGDGDWTVGNLDDNQFSDGIDADFAWHGAWNRVLPIHEIWEQVRRPHRSRGCVLMSWYDGNGTILDISGHRNHGVRTGGAMVTGPSSAIFTKRRRKAFLAPAGQTFQESMAGSLTASGALVRQAQKAVAGSMAPAGSLTKQTAKAFAGSITPTGTLSAIRTVLLSAAGSIAASGALTLQAGKELAGSIAPTGTLARRTDKTMAGSVTATGALATVRTVLISLAGTLAPTGSLTKRALKTMTGSLAPTGSLTKRVSKLLVGTLAALGSLVTTGAVVALTGPFKAAFTGPVRVAIWSPLGRKADYTDPARKADFKEV